MNDLGFQGPKFTWRRGTLHQRLDRCIGNDGWWSMWLNSQLLHLNRIGSDHRPILLVIGPPSVPHHMSTFRYLVAWQSRKEFEGMLAST
ncbi:hypothetical protein V6N13_054539 [Hibiscus sabdariffa]